MTNRDRLPCGWRIGIVASLLVIGGCGLLPKPPPLPAFYALDAPLQATTASASGPTLIVAPPRAAAGFDSTRILYTRQPHRLDYYAHSEWVDTPARMLAPLVVAALAHSGRFGAVILVPAAAAGDLRLDTEVLRLQQDFAGTASQQRFTLRATLVDSRTRKVLASAVFDQAVPAASEDAYGGVVAANLAVARVLQSLTEFCVQASAAAAASGASTAATR